MLTTCRSRASGLKIIASVSTHGVYLPFLHARAILLAIHMRIGLLIVLNLDAEELSFIWSAVTELLFHESKSILVIQANDSIEVWSIRIFKIRVSILIESLRNQTRVTSK